MEYVYELIDDNEGVIGIFTSKQKAIEVAVDGAWVASEKDFDDRYSSVWVEKIPLNIIYY